MAAVIDTPVKLAVNQKCMLCFNDTRRLHCLTNTKSINEGFVGTIQSCLDIQLETSLREFMRVCEPCINTCTNTNSFKSYSKANANQFISDIDRKKRQLLSTPPTAAKKLTVAMQIKSSLDNLKKETPNGNDSSTASTASASHIAEKMEDPKRARKRLDFESSTDHSYSNPSSSLPDVNKTTWTENKDQVDQLLDPSPNQAGKDLHMTLTRLAKPNTSILFNSSPKDLTETQLFLSAVLEMKENCPFLLDILLHALGDRTSSKSKLAVIATIYGMIMHARNPKACAIQKLYTTLALRFHADNRESNNINEDMLLQFMNTVHITLSHESKRNVMSSFGDYSERGIIAELVSGKDGKINGDNLDIFVRTNDIRMTNSNRDYHFFASDWTVDRIDVSSADDSRPLGDVNSVTISSFVPSPDEENIFKKSLKVLLTRIICQYVAHLRWMSSVTPAHISHDLEDVMSQRSSIHWLPVMLKNEAKYGDCVQILNEYEHWISAWYTKAGRAQDLDGLQVPVGGDQLTRVRLQGAKSLMAGAMTPTDRGEHLQPVIMEMFHTLQDFLEKLYKRFYDPKSGKDKGTLYNMKILIDRKNVNGNVKSRFEAHEDFILTVGEAYLLSFVIKHLQMKDLSDEPKHPLLRQNMKAQHNKFKEEVVNEMMEEIIGHLFIPFPQQTESVTLRVTVFNTDHLVTLDHGLDKRVKMNLHINGENFVIDIGIAQAERGIQLTVNGQQGVIPLAIHLVKTSHDDDVQNYAHQFMQWFFIILSIKDAVKEGDIARNNINLKACVPFFFSHSVLSKYLVECIDYVLKTEVTLSEKMSLRVRAASFVNTHGGKGENKAADMQKENEVLVLKQLIRNLGANKTENSIITVCKAAPIISGVVENIEQMLDVHVRHTTHKKRSRTEDINVLVEHLIKLDPWKNSSRKFLQFKGFTSTSPFSFDKVIFNDTYAHRFTIEKGSASIG